MVTLTENEAHFLHTLILHYHLEARLVIKMMLSSLVMAVVKQTLWYCKFYLLEQGRALIFSDPLFRATQQDRALWWAGNSVWLTWRTQLLVIVPQLLGCGRFRFNGRLDLRQWQYLNSYTPNYNIHIDVASHSLPDICS